MNTKKTFFKLLCSELWQAPVAVSQDEAAWTQLLEEAERQSVLGLIVRALIRNHIHLEKPLSVKACSDLMQIKQKNARMNAELQHFTAFMNRHHVRFVVVKGQTVAACYPAPELRQAGDIDFYCDPDDIPRVKDLLTRSLHLSVTTKPTEKHYAFQAGGLNYEMHYSLNDFACRRHQNYWNRILKTDHYGRFMVNGQAVPTLSPTLCALYLFLHIFYHLITTGIGLRQFCDLALFLHTHADDIDRPLLHRHLNRLGMEPAFRAVGALLVQRLQLPLADCPIALKPVDYRRARHIESGIFATGNFGSKVRRHFRSRRLHSLETGIMTFRNLFRYIPLAPREVILNLRRMTLHFLRRNV